MRSEFDAHAGLRTAAESRLHAPLGNSGNCDQRRTCRCAPEASSTPLLAIIFVALVGAAVGAGLALLLAGG